MSVKKPCILKYFKIWKKKDKGQLADLVEWCWVGKGC